MTPDGNHTSVFDVAVVGGGIVGLATAREFLKRQPGLRLAILEKETLLAQHQTGHNSGVIHAGIYYAPGSLKARACVTGRAEIVEYCKEKGIRYELCGKLIVALNEAEVERLMSLYARAQANGVPGVQLINRDRIQEIEPAVIGHKAIWSPNTGIVDWGEVARAYAADALNGGAVITTGARVVSMVNSEDETRIGYVQEDGREREIRARLVVTCAGLYSDHLARMTESESTTRIIPFRGSYYQIAPQKSDICRGMIYPVPDPTFPFLGIHLTRHIDGTVWAGPNAVLAFRREGYRRWDIFLPELLETLTYPGFWKLAIRYWKTGIKEMYRDYLKGAYVNELRRYTPEIKGEDLVAEKSGVRAQALERDGTMVDDFMIRHGSRVVHVLNAPSPAATSSLVIARMIVDSIEQNGLIPQVRRLSVNFPN